MVGALPSQTGRAPFPLAPRNGSRQSLAGEIRLLLSEFQGALCADSSALLVHAEETSVLQVQSHLPGRHRLPRTHPLCSNCILVKALELRRAIRATPQHCCAVTCEACGELFGAPAIAVVPISIDEKKQAIVAAFGHPSGYRRPRFRTAYCLARHLGTFLASYAMAQKAERRASELAIVNEVAANLTSTMDTDVLFPKILAEIRRVIRYDTATLYLFDHEERRLRIVAQRGFSSDQQVLLEETAWERTPGIVFHSRQPVLLYDVRRYLRTRGTTRRVPFLSRFRSTVVVPIVFGGQSLGVMALNSVEAAAFGDEDLRLVTSLANHAAIAIANAQLYHQVDVRLQLRLRDLTNLSRIGQAISTSLETQVVLQTIVRGTSEAFGPSGSMIVLRDDKDDQFVVAAEHALAPTQVGRRVQMDEHPAGWIIRHGQPLFVPSPSNDIFESLKPMFERWDLTSFIGAPLVIQGQAVGALSVHPRRGQHFEANDLELLQGLAAQAAIAIEHAALYESVAREKAKLEAIVESLHEGLMLVNPGRAIIYASRRFADLVGIDLRLLRDSTMDQVWNYLITRCATLAEATESLKRIEYEAPEALVLSLARPQRQELAIQSFNVHALDGGLLGRGYLMRDVTREVGVERLKASILSTASHELRTPLAAIKGFATSLLRTDIEWEEASRHDFLQQIDREADRLTVLVRNLLDMSRLEAGTLRLNCDWCDLYELVVDVITRMAPVVADHRVGISCDAPDVVAFVDRHCLERVLWNLVDNAVKYSPSGSNVNIDLAKAGSDFMICVTDHGVGIGSDERERIFERFYRSPGTRATGLGIGLAVCRALVEAHGGTIDVEGERGEGSVFSVRLPRYAGSRAT